MKLSSKRGFTLIELVVVMGIIALLALLIIGAVVTARRMVTETKHRNNGKAIQVGMEKYYAANKAYPAAALIPDPSSFATAANTLTVGQDPTTGEVAACTSGAVSGGGTVTNITSTTYTINPYNYNCTAALGDTYVQPQ